MLEHPSTAEIYSTQDSSRSHSIFTVIVEMVTKGGSADGLTAGSVSVPSSPSKLGSTAGGSGIRVGKLHLVDLAGSERQSKTSAAGERLKEAAKINLSLSGGAECASWNCDIDAARDHLLVTCPSLSCSPR